MSSYYRITGRITDKYPRYTINGKTVQVLEIKDTKTFDTFKIECDAEAAAGCNIGDDATLEGSLMGNADKPMNRILLTHANTVVKHTAM